MYYFNSQKKIGDAGEKKFKKHYKGLNPVSTDGRDNDLKVVLDGKEKTVELKTDSWDMEETPNVFLERFGNLDKKTDGGPFSALNNEVDFFVYFFISNSTFLWYKPEDLCNYIKKNESKLEWRQIQNKNYVSWGALVPRADLEHLLVRKDTF